MKLETASKKQVQDMTEGNALKLILFFAMPIFLGNIFQQLYNIVDTMLAGRYLGDLSLAAIGATSTIYSMIFSLVNGMNNGYSIIVARAFGEKDYEKVRDSVGLMLILNIVTSVGITALALAFIYPLLRSINTPEEIMREALSYIVVVLGGLTITIFYNMEAGVLRALGNSRTPLFYLIIACVINIVLDILFVVGFEMGVVGLALATVIAQTISVIACYVHIRKNYKMLKLHKSNFAIHKEPLHEMFSTGLSMGLMYSIFSIGTFILQGAINSLGTLTITAHFAARKVLEMLILPIGTISTANATFVSQNFGAGNLGRVKEGIKKSCILGFIWSAIVTVAILLFAENFVQLMTGTSEAYVIATASGYLKINVPFYFVLTVLLILRTSLQGMGRKVVPLVSSTMELVIKVVATWMLIPVIGYLGVCIVEPIIWVVCMIWLLICYLRLWKRYEKLC